MSPKGGRAIASHRRSRPTGPSLFHVSALRASINYRGAAVSAAGKLYALAEHCERATEPNRDLDAAIGSYLASIGTFSCFGCDDPLRFTASLDAAMTLVPEDYEWGAGSWGNPDTDGPWAWCATKRQSSDNDLDYGKAKTTALALCAAALRARAASADTHPEDGDVKQAPLVSGAVPDRADAQPSSSKVIDQ